MKNQRGMSIYAILYVLITLGFVGYIGMMVFTPMMEYMSVKKVFSSMSNQELSDGSDARLIRNGFDRRATIDNINAIKSADLEITKEGNTTVITVAWTVKVPLFWIVSLVLDFNVTASGK